ncbi:hypothetical protein BA190_26910 [Labrys sp. WJW]|uniref:hypothetical protein n=1 Tax=Labrys sp. WJW TaxID=1737983 RepID=UPI000829837D|nr:hypothetical protein [Labrys sp. WJW]OCC01846.1 hypothetical protein BA190_26910 [Labrys sp. WJW]
MALRDCLASAAAQGEITREEADRLASMYEEHVQAARGTDDPRGAEAVAQASLAKQLSDDALRKERLANLQANATRRVLAQAEAYAGPVKGKADIIEGFLGTIENRNAGLYGGSSVIGRRDALIGSYHGQMENMLTETRRKLGSGFRRGSTDLRDMVREAYGQATGNAQAKAWYDAFARTAEQARQDFNAAGGDIGQLKDWRLPQGHDAVAIQRAGRETWKQYIGEQLDVSKMRDPLSGGPLSPERLNEALDAIYERVVTNGAVDLEPSGQARGRGALANQRQEERFLHFKDAQAWLAYNDRFGGGDIHRTLTEHFHGMAKDTAAMEVLGPNPNATIEWMKQVVDHEAAEAALGRQSRYTGKDPAGKLKKGATGTNRIDRLWTVVNGSVGTGSMALADTMGAVRNTLMAAQLAGAAATSFVSDPFQQMLAGSFAGIPRLRMIGSTVKTLLSGQTRREIDRAGIVMADAAEHLNGEIRRATLTATAHEASKWLPDRTFAWTGLTPWTRTLRRANGLSFMFEAGDRASLSLAQMAASRNKGAQRFGRWLEGFGIDEDTWSIIRGAEGADHGSAGRMIRPADVMARDREAGLRYSEALHAFIEEATPEGTSRARVMVGRDTKAGTLAGETVRSTTSYLTYPTSTMLSLTRMIAHEAQGGGFGGVARGTAFATGAVISLTLAGAMAEQVYHLRNGKDPRNMADHEFWIKAFARGGALGYYGDYVLGDYKRGSGEAASRFAGPVAGAVGDLLALANVNALTADEDANRGRQAAKIARQYTPFARMWWLKPVADRVLFDQLQLLADPRAHSAWDRESRRIFKETGQREWWNRSQAEPSRAPNFSHLFGD